MSSSLEATDCARKADDWRLFPPSFEMLNFFANEFVRTLW